jgi:hypothetical protein
MKVLLALADGCLARPAIKAIEAQGHRVQWQESVSNTWPNIDESQPIGIVIAGDCKGIGSPTQFARTKGIPFIACHGLPTTRESAVREGAVLELPPRLLVPALRKDALNINAAITWTPGNVAKDIPEPYFTRLAQLVVQDHVGNHARIQRMAMEPDKGLIAYCSGLSLPTFNLRYRAHPVHWERAT